MGSIHSVRGSRPVVGRLAHTARHRKSEIGLGGVTLRVSHRKRSLSISQTRCGGVNGAVVLSRGAPSHLVEKTSPTEKIWKYSGAAVPARPPGAAQTKRHPSPHPCPELPCAREAVWPTPPRAHFGE